MPGGKPTWLYPLLLSLEGLFELTLAQFIYFAANTDMSLTKKN